MDQSDKHNSPPLTEILKTIPDVLGVRLNEKLAYSVLEKDGDIEIRHYPKFILAQITENGPREEALRNGFQHLADYIFGEKIAMTAPVFHEPKDGKWLISFTMPSKYSSVTLLQPKNSNIKIVEKEAKNAAAITYSGTNNENLMRESEDRLQGWLSEHRIKMTSGFYCGQYDPPFAIPVMKRNEVLAKIDYTGSKQ